MSRRRLKQQWIPLSDGLPEIHANAAGIDVGSEEHWVGLPPGRASETVRRFGAFTSDLYELANWLKQCRIDTVAMESTGVYWIPLYQVLEERGFQVLLVNARYAKNVAGRKTDVLDCQWLQKLHSYGLLPGSFRASGAICTLRTYLRHRQMLIEYGAAHVQHMQKALTQMNLKLANVISDITGVTGMKIIRAIVGGERNPSKLAELRDWRTKNNEDTIAKALEGDYRNEHVFELTQALELWDYYQGKLAVCDQHIAEYLKTMESKVDSDTSPIPPVRLKKTRRRNDPYFDARQAAHRISGVDLTQIDGISESAALTILSEIGTDMSPWKTEKHFASWLALCPNNRISGGKILQRRTRRAPNHVANVLRVCSQSLMQSKSALGAYCRRMCSRIGAPKAITATAHKLALLIYRMIRLGKTYVDIGQEKYEHQYQNRKLKTLARKAKEMGMQLVPLPS